MDGTSASGYYRVVKIAGSALTTVSWTPRLGSFREETSLAIARLDARISASPVRGAWSLRASWTGYSTAQQLQDVEIDEADIFACAIGVALPGRPLRSSLDDCKRTKITASDGQRRFTMTDKILCNDLTF